jgi:hypothetical protein
MSKISSDKLKLIRKLYLSDNFSAREIGEKLNVSIDAVFYFLRKNKIPRRNPTQSNNASFARKVPSFKIKENLNAEEKELKAIGVTLYWGEGSKWDGENIVDFTNSDSEMIAVFMKFLRKICGINETKLRVYLYCYADQKPKELENFWSKLTGIPTNFFYKPYVRKDFKVEKSGKMKNGLIHVRYNDKKLLLILRKWIEDIKSVYC